MQNSKEKGITLVALLMTIVILLILVSIGVTSGVSTIESVKFSRFKSELKILQTKINELNQNNEDDINIGIKDLTQEQIDTISKNISNTDNSIIEGFKYCDSICIQRDLGLEGIQRNYLINIQYRYVICTEGVEYNGNIYYMINQIEDGAYNVEYNDKNPKNGDFEVNAIKEGDRWKIEISNITYSGYISNWNVQYRFSENENENWNTANGLKFYVTKEGNYYIQLLHDDINLGTKLVTVLSETE